MLMITSTWCACVPATLRQSDMELTSRKLSAEECDPSSSDFLISDNTPFAQYRRKDADKLRIGENYGREIYFGLVNIEFEIDIVTSVLINYYTYKKNKTRVHCWNFRKTKLLRSNFLQSTRCYKSQYSSPHPVPCNN